MVNHWRRTLMVLLGGGVFIGGFVLLGTWMGPIGDKIALIFDLVAYGGLAVFLFAWILILALKSTVRRVWFGFTDAAVRRQSLVVDPLTRPKIEDTLTHLALVQSRIAYLQEVYNSGLKPTGEWFNGYPPKFGGDESDDFLARLEERWLVE